MSRQRHTPDLMTPDLFAQPELGEVPEIPEMHDAPEAADITAPTEAAPMPPQAAAQTAPHTTLQQLQAWRDAGWLRRLDVALAGFVQTLDPAASPALLLSTAWLAHMEGRGHTCLPLAPLVQAPNEVLGWPAAALPELQASVQTVAVDSAEVSHWCDALRASPVVRTPAHQPDLGQPLVLIDDGEQPRLYLRRYWNHEQLVAAQVRARCLLPTGEASSADAGVDEPLIRRWLDRLFPAPAAANPDSSTAAPPDWQKLACAVAMRGRLSVITGGPGTGKTYTAARLLALLLATSPDPERLRVALAAPTGKAAARLKQAIDTSLIELQSKLGQGDDAAPDLGEFTRRMGPATTLHALLGARPDTRAMRHHAGAPLDVDVLIVDEASMVHLEMMAALLDALPPGARLILLGDKDQLASVEAGAVLGDLCRDAEAGGWSAQTARYALATAGVVLPAAMLAAGAASPLAQQTVMLRESRRFAGPIGQLALAVNRGDAETAHRCLHSGSTGGDRPVMAHEPARLETLQALALHGRPGAEGGYATYLNRVKARPPVGDVAAHQAWVVQVLKAFDTFRILCAVREGDWGAAGVNRSVVRTLAGAGLLSPSGEWYAGRPVMVTRNDAALGVSNGDIGIALPSAAAGGGLRVWFLDGEVPRSVGVSRLAHVDTAFAMTVHKSQGSEFAHTVMVLPEQAGQVLSRELVYTGITRARTAFTLVSARAGALAAAMSQPTRRASGLGASLRDAA
ncbi:MAG: exodeoxyribonuclease V subunit alpha [Burkholderiales bacterium PBB6]|nr:MAG: exodeoxyribonuclease V subunit alpha [Burkholderiales bacterium PBB6]